MKRTDALKFHTCFKSAIAKRVITIGSRFRSKSAAVERPRLNKNGIRQAVVAYRLLSFRFGEDFDLNHDISVPPFYRWAKNMSGLYGF